MQETRFQSLGQEDPLEEEMATYSSIFTWEIPGTEEPGGLQSMGSKKSQTRLRSKKQQQGGKLVSCGAAISCTSARRNSFALLWVKII